MTEPADNTEICVASAGVDSPAVPMNDVLIRVGHELARLARRLDHLQHVIGPLVAEAARRDTAVQVEMQGFDDIEQEIVGLSAFIAALPPLACRCLVDPLKATDAVTLGDLAARLGFRDTAAPSRATLSGDLEIF